MNSVREVLRVAAARLHTAGSPSPRVDAEYLLQHVLKKNLFWLRAHDEVRLSPHEDHLFAQAMARRVQGEPVAYITGSRGFWSLELMVNASTLIPRPDTEILVEFALEKMPIEQLVRVLDLGTGSGAIALAVKTERPLALVTAVDASASALEVAAANADHLKLDVELLQSDWFSALVERRFDLLLANPPYINANDAHVGQGDLRFEPLSALVSAGDGLADIRRIAAAAPLHLQPGGWLALEHGYDQGEAVRQILLGHGFVEVATRLDLGGQERISVGRLLDAATAENNHAQ